MDYLEKKFGVRRAFDLKEGSLVISRQGWFGTTARTVIALDRVKPIPDEAMVKYGMNTANIGGIPGAAITIISAVVGNHLYSISPALFYGLIYGGIIAMIFGYMLGFLLGRRLKTCVFRNRDEVLIFDITERGNSRAQFDAFIATLRSHIQSARR